MNKRGQFYIIGALLLIVYIFIIVPKPTITGPQITAFERLHENYMTDVPVTVNRAVLSAGNSTGSVADYSASYWEYGRTVDPGFGFIAAYKDDTDLWVGNYLDRSVEVTLSGVNQTLEREETLSVTAPSTLQIHIAEISYTFTYEEDKELKVIFRKQAGDEIAVHVEQ